MSTVDVEPSLDTVQRIIAGGAIAFGVAGLIAPAALGKAYGLDDTPQQRYLGRFWAVATGALGVTALGTPPGPERRNLGLLVAGMNVLDAAVALSTSGLPMKTRVLSSSTSLAFAAAGGYLAVTED